MEKLVAWEIMYFLYAWTCIFHAYRLGPNETNDDRDVDPWFVAVFLLSAAFFLMVHGFDCLWW